MSDNRRNKRRRKIKDGLLNTEPKQHSLKYQNQKIREQEKFVKQYTAHRNEALRAAPAQHPGPSSSAERTQRAAVAYAANEGVEDIDMDSQWQNIDDDNNTSLPSGYKRWQDVSEVLLKNFVESHQVHGHADPCLTKPITLGTKPTNCDCNTRQTSWPIHGFMMFEHRVFQVEFCTHQTLLESLLMSQMLPTAPKKPKSAVHFSLFESMIDNRLNAYSSVSGFIKANNASNLRLSSFDPMFKPLPANFNEMAVVYQRVKRHSTGKHVLTTWHGKRL